LGVQRSMRGTFHQTKVFCFFFSKKMLPSLQLADIPNQP